MADLHGQNSIAGKNSTVNWHNVDITLLEACMVEQTNIIRKQKGVNMLQTNALLQKAALLHSFQMDKYSFFSHTNTREKEISTPEKRLYYYNYNFTSYAENILYTYIDKNNPPTYTQLAKTAIGLLYKSKGHRINMLNGLYNEMGIGIVLAQKQDADYQYFYVTQDFGKR